MKKSIKKIIEKWFFIGLFKIKNRPIILIESKQNIKVYYKYKIFIFKFDSINYKTIYYYLADSLIDLTNKKPITYYMKGV